MVFLIIPGMFVPIGFAIAAIAFAIGKVYHRKQMDRRRNADLAGLAAQLGLDYREKDEFGLLQQLKSFDLFRRMRRWFHNGQIVNVLSGRIGETDVYLFDYIYYVSSNNSRRRITQTVFFANDKNWFLPDFRLKPETWWDKVMERLGMASDINFPEQPEFSNQFRLNGEMTELVREKFSPAVRQYLTERPPTHLEGNNYYLIAYKPRKKLNADEARDFFEHCCELAKLMKQEGKMELLNLAELRPVEMPEAIKLSEKE